MKEVWGIEKKITKNEFSKIVHVQSPGNKWTDVWGGAV